MSACKTFTLWIIRASGALQLCWLAGWLCAVLELRLLLLLLLWSFVHFSVSGLCVRTQSKEIAENSNQKLLIKIKRLHHLSAGKQ
jgi:hypothetical protein